MSLSQEVNTWGTIASLVLNVVLAAIAIWLASNDAAIIKDSLSTRYVRAFPKHLGEIVALIERAGHEIMIFGDSVDYGSYGRPGVHTEYMEALLNCLERGRRVQYLVWGRPAAFSKANKQDLFGKRMERFLLHLEADKRVHVQATSTRPQRGRIARAWSRLRTWITGSQRANIRTFFSDLDHVFHACRKDRDDRFAEGKEFANVELKDIVACVTNHQWPNSEPGRLTREALMLCLHEWVRTIYEKAGASVDIRREKDSPELFFWVIDKSEAIFLLPTGEEDALAFRTKDRHLVKTFVRIFRDRQNQVA